MVRLAVPIVLVLLMLVAGAAWALFGYLNLPPSPAATPHAADTQAPASGAPTQQGKQSRAHESAASFDVARIDPDGTSVFAGRAEPHARVTIMGDGEPIGTAQADENGEWTLAVEHKFASADPELKLVVSAAETQQAAGRGETRAGATPAQGATKSARAVKSHLIKDLEGMVKDARTAERRQVAKAEAAATVPEDKAAPGEAGLHKSVPVPITFIFNEATFTDDGRRAAGLLLEYLKLKRFKKVSLTGHADERGTEELNMDLSKERLDTVAHYLRKGGYDGALELIPKGESEPFTGVVRSQFNQEELWQLDRRVELIIAP